MGGFAAVGGVSGVGPLLGDGVVDGLQLRFGTVGPADLEIRQTVQGVGDSGGGSGKSTGGGTGVDPAGSHPGGREKGRERKSGTRQGAEKGRKGPGAGRHVSGRGKAVNRVPGIKNTPCPTLEAKSVPLALN